MTPIVATVDDRLAALCHTAVDTTAVETVRRLRSQGSNHNESAVERDIPQSIAPLSCGSGTGGEGSWRASL